MEAPLAAQKTAHLNLMLLLGLALLLGHCSSEGEPDGGPPPNPAGLGTACGEEAPCATGDCLLDERFADGYCTVSCTDDPETCPQGTTCQTFAGLALCFADCGEDDHCRDGYVCTYDVCRPPCDAQNPCAEGDTCIDGHCRPPCTDDDECPGGRCQDGGCLPPCTRAEDCLPGFGCENATGHCVALPGNAMGDACTQSAECATGYCLPTRKICSIRCNKPGGCPRGYACGLEKVDSDGNGKFNSAEADCVPAVGSGAAMAGCGKDEDCASGHCQLGFCMEACTKNEDCGGGNCTPVTLVLGDDTGTYSGCLPAAGSGLNYLLGEYSSFGVAGIDVPPGAASVIISTEVAPGEVGAVTMFLDPAGEKIVDPNQTMDICGFYSQPNRYFPDQQLASLFYPITPAMPLKTGLHTAYLATSQADPMKVWVSLKLGQAQKGTLDINWYFLNLAGTCVPIPALNAASAPAHSWMTELRGSLAKILQTANIGIGNETFQDLSNPSLDILNLNDAGPSPEADALFSASKGQTGPAVNIFLVREIQATAGLMGGIVLGLSGGIPGPPAIHGTAHSGIAFSVQTACFQLGGYNPGHTLAHEVGHYLGLFHNLEAPTNPGYDEETNTVRCGCPCGANLVCEQGKWCRGLDPIPDTTASNSNLMYFAAENTQDFFGNQLSPGQIRVMLDNPIVGH